MIMKKLILYSVIWIFLVGMLFYSFPAGAEDTMHYSPRTPAGGGFVPAGSQLSVALAVEHGSEALITRAYYYNYYSTNYNAHESPINIYDTGTTVTTGTGGNYSQTINN